jgi:hypothetical protein
MPILRTTKQKGVKKMLKTVEEPDPKTKVLWYLDYLAEELDGNIGLCNQVIKLLNPDKCNNYYSAVYVWREILDSLRKTVIDYTDRLKLIWEG